MAFNINEFRSQMQGDGARPNLFEVTMPFPAFSLPGNAQTKLSFMYIKLLVRNGQLRFIKSPKVLWAKEE